MVDDKKEGNKSDDKSDDKRNGSDDKRNGSDDNVNRGFLSGIFAGVCDTIFNYPPYLFHYKVQRGDHISFLRNANTYKPRELYRGVGSYAFIIPITSISAGVSGSLERRGVSTHVATITSGMVAATIISAPVGNAIVTNLRLKASGINTNSYLTVKHIIRTMGIRGFYIGAVPLLIREGIYSWSVFSGQSHFQVKYGYNEAKSTIIAGIVATFLSQPCDTLATRMQDRGFNLRQGIRSMLQEGGIFRFYKGFGFRLYAIIAGIYVMNKGSDIAHEWLTSPPIQQ